MKEVPQQKNYQNKDQSKTKIPPNTQRYSQKNNLSKDKVIQGQDSKNTEVSNGRVVNG